jgi:phage baseplate assembly protein W
MRTSFNPIRNVQVPSLRQFSDELLGTDLYEQNFDSMWAPNDDYQVIAGLGNLKQAIYHRLITNPGELFAHPEYGAGLEEYISVPIDRSMKSEIMQRIKNQLLQEPRIAKIGYIRVNTGNSTTPSGTLVMEVGIVPIGINTEQAFQYAITEQDWLLRNNRPGGQTYIDMAKEREYASKGITAIG